MSDEKTSKELIPASTAVKARSKPSLLPFGNHVMSSDGKYHPDLAAEYLLQHRDRWVKVSELAKVFCRASTITTKHRIRRQVPALFTRMLAAGHLVTIESDARTNRADALKVYDPRSEQDRQTIQVRLERMQKRKQVTSTLLAQAFQLIEQYEQAAAQP